MSQHRHAQDGSDQHSQAAISQDHAVEPAPAPVRPVAGWISTGDLPDRVDTGFHHRSLPNDRLVIHAGRSDWGDAGFFVSRLMVIPDEREPFLTPLVFYRDRSAAERDVVSVAEGHRFVRDSAFVRRPVEGYLAEPAQTGIGWQANGRTIAVIDTETGGFLAEAGPAPALLSVGITIPRHAGVEAGQSPSFRCLILPSAGTRVDGSAAAINGYAPVRWAEQGAIPEAEALRRVADFLAAHAGPDGIQPMAHGADFDASILRQAVQRSGVPLPQLDGRPWACTLTAVDDQRIAGRYTGSRRLSEVHQVLVGTRFEHHQAEHDAIAAGEVAMALWQRDQEIPLVQV